MPRTCPQCGRPVPLILAGMGSQREQLRFNRRRDMVYCSGACRTAAWRDRRRERRDTDRKVG